MSQSPRRSIRHVTALQSTSNATAATPRALIRDLLAAPPTQARQATGGGRRTRAVSRVVDESFTNAAATANTAESLTPRNLIRNVANFETPFSSRTNLSSFASTAAAAAATATAAQLPPPPPPLFMQQAAAASTHQDVHQVGHEIDDDDASLLASGPRVRRAASAAERAHVRDLQAQLAAIGHQFIDPGAPVATLALFPPVAAMAERRSRGRGRGRPPKRKPDAAMIGGADARRRTDDVDDGANGGDDDDNNNNNNNNNGALVKKRRVASMMPGSWVKQLFLASTAPGVTVSAEVVKTVLKLSDQYWTRAVDDLCAYADTKPRGGAVVSADDVELLFSRQRLTNNSRSVDDLAREFLPADLRRDVVPIARANNVVEPASAHRHSKKQSKKQRK